jgi:SH3/ankyrin repeat-containing protein
VATTTYPTTTDRNNLKRFTELVVKKHAGKVNDQLDKGVDPNYHIEESGETPLTLAALQDNSELVTALVSG